MRATLAALKQADDLRLFFSARHRDKAAFLPKKVGLSHLTNYFRQIFCPCAMNGLGSLSLFISLRLKTTEDNARISMAAMASFPHSLCRINGINLLFGTCAKRFKRQLMFGACQMQIFCLRSHHIMDSTQQYTPLLRPTTLNNHGGYHCFTNLLATTLRLFL